MQVGFEGGFSADADRFAFGADRAIVFAPGCRMQPCAVHFAKMVLQPRQLTSGQLANGFNAVLFEFFIGLGANAIDFAAA